MKQAVLPILLAAAMTACAQPTTTSGEPTMLSEIYATKIPNSATQRAGVGGIVSKYLSVGTSRAETIEFLNGLGEGQIQDSPREIVYTTRQGEGFKGNRRDVVVKIRFDPTGRIESVTSHIDKSNNL